MLEKLLIYPGKTDQGIFTYVIDRLDQGYLEKTASEYNPEIAAYISQAKPIPGRTQILLTALGAGEFWGPNVNGDFFPETALAYSGPEYGYKTFEYYAKPYQHHINKDPNAAYGDVILAVYNPILHRVELIVGLDNAKAPDIVRNIEQGIYPDWSMGCKVPFDICSNCGNKAPKREFYCDCLRYYMLKIHPETGKLCYAINTLPRFFDISRVIIGADRIAKTLMKVASGSARKIFIMGSADLAAKMATAHDMSEYKKAEYKNATMVKEVPTSAPPASEEAVDDLVRSIPEVKAREHTLPVPVLDRLGQAPFSKSMSTLAMLGILPKPQEFQRIVLISSGRPRLADELWKRNVCFDPTMVEDASDKHMDAMSIQPERFSSDLFQTLKPHMEERSHAAPLLGKRITIIIKRASQEDPPTFIKTASEWEKKLPADIFNMKEGKSDKRTPLGPIPVLMAAAGLYHAFSRKAPMEAAKGIDKLLVKHPGLMAALGLGILSTFDFMGGKKEKGQFGADMVTNPDVNDIFARIEKFKEKPILKVAALSGVRAAGKRLFLGIPAAYTASNLLQKHRDIRPYEEEGRIRKFLRRYPDVVSGALIVDAMLSARGKGTFGAIRKAKGLWNPMKQTTKSMFPRFAKTSAVLEDMGVSTPFIKTADPKEWLSSAAIWPIALGTKNLPGRIVGGLLDQAFLDASSRLLKKSRKPKSAVLPSM